MRWTAVKKVGSEDEWFSGYVAAALNSVPPSLPAPSQRIGSVDINWFETEPGIAFIQAEGGTPDDRVLARLYLKAQLKPHGYRVAEYTFDAEDSSPDDDWRFGSLHLSTWTDIMAKAKRLIQSGNVQILRNGYNNIVGYVQGDHGEYQTEIGRDDPSSRSITTWQCDCPWDQYAWQRTRQWKKYEGRPCAHILATYWRALATPLDEDIHPAQNVQTPMAPPQPQQLSLFNMPPGGMMQPAMPQTMMPMQQPMQQQIGMPMQPGPGVIPPFPMEGMDQLEPTPVSIPGAKPPYDPRNPIQGPSTYSKVSADWGKGWYFPGSDRLVVWHGPEHHGQMWDRSEPGVPLILHGNQYDDQGLIDPIDTSIGDAPADLAERLKPHGLEPSYGEWHFGTKVAGEENWVTCANGHKHYGLHGAAGLLLHHTDENGTTRYLLDHRAPFMQHGNTWSIPGGALHENESPVEGAYREAAEEVGDIPGFRHLRTSTADCGGWPYHTVHGEVPQMFDPQGGPTFEGQPQWVNADEVDRLPLHPGFARFWRDYRQGHLSAKISDWDFNDEPVEGGYKWVWRPGLGGAIGPHTTYHSELGWGAVSDEHWGVITPDGIINDDSGHDDRPDDLLAYLQSKVPGARWPTDAAEARKADEYGWKIAAQPQHQLNADFANGAMVQLIQDDQGVAEGKSEADGAGQYMSILQNTRGLGEVMGMDDLPGFGQVVEVIFPLDNTGPMQPYHIRAWLSPDKLKPRPDIPRPGPMIKRRK